MQTASARLPPSVPLPASEQTGAEAGPLTPFRVPVPTLLRIAGYTGRRNRLYCGNTPRRRGRNTARNPLHSELPPFFASCLLRRSASCFLSGNSGARYPSWHTSNIRAPHRDTSHTVPDRFSMSSSQNISAWKRHLFREAAFHSAAEGRRPAFLLPAGFSPCRSLLRYRG